MLDYIWIICSLSATNLTKLVRSDWQLFTPSERRLLWGRRHCYHVITNPASDWPKYKSYRVMQKEFAGKNETKVLPLDCRWLLFKRTNISRIVCRFCKQLTIQLFMTQALGISHFQGRRSNSRARGPTGTKEHWRPYSAKIYYPLSQPCTAYIARYWLCIDKGVKRLGEFLPILNITWLELLFQAEIQ